MYPGVAVDASRPFARRRCGCVTNRCSGNPEGQSCSTYSNSCNVVSGPNFIELTCL